MKSGIESFVQALPTASFLYDIKLKTAALLKSYLQHDETWNSFTQQASQMKSQVQQTALGFMAPPNQRTKARYMNLEVLVRWGKRAVVLLDQIENKADIHERYEKIKLKLGWLNQFRESLKEWDEICQVTITAESFVHKQGLWQGCDLDLSKRFDFIISSSTAIEIREQLLAFVKNESLKANPNERLLGSSEVIESAFGKMKREDSYNKRSFLSISKVPYTRRVATHAG